MFGKRIVSSSEYTMLKNIERRWRGAMPVEATLEGGPCNGQVEMVSCGVNIIYVPDFAPLGACKLFSAGFEDGFISHEYEMVPEITYRYRGD